MPLTLDDNRWNTLLTAYREPAGNVAKWLAIAYRTGISDELLGDIINDVQHQGDTSEAMYAVAPHLLELSASCDQQIALQLIVHAGLICAASQLKSSVSCPPDLLDEFESTKKLGQKLALAQLSTNHEFDNFKYLIAALAGFSGHGRFGRLIEYFDFFENRFYHALIDEPINE